MLADSSVSQKLWAEAINTACYNQNRSMINKRFNKKTILKLFNKYTEYIDIFNNHKVDILFIFKENDYIINIVNNKEFLYGLLYNFS